MYYAILLRSHINMYCPLERIVRDFILYIFVYISISFADDCLDFTEKILKYFN